MSRKLDNIFHKAAGYASSAVSNIIPGTISAKVHGARAARGTKIIKQARKYDNAPSRDDKGNITDAGKARSLADEVRADAMRRARQGKQY